MGNFHLSTKFRILGLRKQYPHYCSKFWIKFSEHFCKKISQNIVKKKQTQKKQSIIISFSSIWVSIFFLLGCSHLWSSLQTVIPAQSHHCSILSQLHLITHQSHHYSPSSLLNLITAHCHHCSISSLLNLITPNSYHSLLFSGLNLITAQSHCC